MAFNVGDRVKVKDTFKIKTAITLVSLPDYLTGQVGTVIGWIPGFVKVAFDEDTLIELRFNKEGRAIFWYLPGGWLERDYSEVPKIIPTKPEKERVDLMDLYLNLSKRVDELEDELSLLRRNCNE